MELREVTGERGMERRIDGDPAHRAALAALGFRRVGLSFVRLPWFYAFVAPRVVRGIVTEVLVAPDGSAQASAEDFRGTPIVVFRTAFEDGHEVVTRLLPARIERGWAQITFASTPGLGRWCRNVDTDSVEIVWDAHRAHVEEHVATGIHGPVARHDDMLTWFALDVRGTDLAHAKSDAFAPELGCWGPAAGLALLGAGGLGLWLAIPDLMQRVSERPEVYGPAISGGLLALWFLGAVVGAAIPPRLPSVRERAITLARGDVPTLEALRADPRAVAALRQEIRGPR